MSVVRVGDVRTRLVWIVRRVIIRERVKGVVHVVVASTRTHPWCLFACVRIRG